MSSFYVFAEISPKPEHFEKAREAILSIVDETRREPGCLTFNLFDNEDDHRLFLFEQWQSEAALAAHYAKPYTAAVFEKYQTWLRTEPAIRKMTRQA